MSDTRKDSSDNTTSSESEKNAPEQNKSQSGGHPKDEKPSHPSRNHHGAEGHNESDQHEEQVPDQDYGTQKEDDASDEVIKVARTPTSPALLSQLEHRRDYARARGLGAGHTGAATWKVQRMTALALIPLAIWFVVSVIRMSFASQAAAADWLAWPVNAAVMAVFIVIALRHAVIGIESVFEDYVDGEGLRAASVLLVKLIALVLAVASIAALIHLAI